MSLSVAERKALAEAWIESGKRHGVKISNHIGAASISDSRELAKHAEEVGCVMISAMPPYFFKPGNVKVVADWLKTIGEAAPKTPLYYYHFPAITGVNIDPFLLLLAIEEVGVPTFRGFKFTEFNLWHYCNCVQYANGRYDCVYGRDEAMLGGLALGAKASIGNAFCFSAGIYHRLRDAWFKGDVKTAQLEQGRSCKAVSCYSSNAYGGNSLVCTRAIMEMKGVPLGPPRAPHVPMTPAQLAAFKAELEEIGFWQWAD
jgi:N-acetylneuraminate lyase